MNLITWVKKTLHLGNGTLRIMRVVESGKCDDCGHPVSKDIDDGKEVHFVCTNLLCGHRYVVEGIGEV